MIICNFGSNLGEMKKKDEGDIYKVLSVLKDSPRFSVFDINSNKLAKSMDHLKDAGLIIYPKPQPGFPWSVVAITSAGERFLRTENLAQRTDKAEPNQTKD